MGDRKYQTNVLVYGCMCISRMTALTLINIQRRTRRYILAHIFTYVHTREHKLHARKYARCYSRARRTSEVTPAYHQTIWPPPSPSPETSPPWAMATRPRSRARPPWFLGLTDKNWRCWMGALPDRLRLIMHALYAFIHDEDEVHVLFTEHGVACSHVIRSWNLTRL